jgi:imidazolonepropionase-like amidohydrolase
MKAIVGARMLDGLGNPARDNAVVLVDGGRIEAVGDTRTLSIPDDAEVIDLSGMTLLPGLIDTHLHLLGHRTMNPADSVWDGEGLRAARGTSDLRRLLHAGITTVRDCGSYTALALKRAVAEGSIPGPRVLAVGRFIERTGGADDAPYMPLEWAQRGGPFGSRLADGPAEVRKAVREQVRDGADWIKTCSTGAVMTQPDSRPDILEWSDEEIAVLVEESHRLGKRVAVHAHAVNGIRQALEAGADTIEHGTYLDDECARMMVDSGRYLVPTFFVLRRMVEHGAEFGTPEWVLRKAREVIKVRDQTFQLALRHGVPIAMGTDCGGQDLLPHGANAAELAMMVSAGMTPADAIVAATSGAARCIGVEREVGSIEAGRQADLIAVADDPLGDITALERVAFVMQRGEVVRTNPTPGPSPRGGGERERDAVRLV